MTSNGSIACPLPAPCSLTRFTYYIMAAVPSWYLCCSVFKDHSVIQEVEKRVTNVKYSKHRKRNSDETEIEEMENGFLIPADVGRDREPRLRARRVPRPVVELGGRVP